MVRTGSGRYKTAPLASALVGAALALALGPIPAAYGSDCVAAILRQGKAVEQTQIDHRGRAFIGLAAPDAFTREDDTATGVITLTSRELDSPLPANEAVVSWNVDAPVGAGIKVEARAYTAGHYSRYYTLGLWSKDGLAYPRASVNGQKDADGDVQTDTLALKAPLTKLQVRVTLTPAPAGPAPTLKYIGISLTDTHAHPAPLPPDKSAWGQEIEVPGRTQLGWPGASGWCSPTSTAMALAFWSKRLNRADLDVPVPDAARAIYDRVYDGTGNWPFNTAFAGSFPGMKAYVTRFSDIRELEAWISAGIPVVVSVSYDLLKGKLKDEDPGHLMVCDGFTAEGDLVLNDPAHHPERGEACRRVFSRANFLRGWGRSHFLVYLIYPQGTKVPADIYGHWDSRAP